jgi:hypothetical protein
MKVKVFILLLGVATFGLGVLCVGVLQLFVSLIEAPVATTPNYEELQRAAHFEALPASPEKAELSCYDPNILAIWQELKRDAKFRRALEVAPGRADCSNLLRVELVELDGDKFDEFIVWGKDMQRFCGATGNCDVWVFDLAKDRVSKLLSSGGIDVEVEKSRSLGFRNLVVRFNGSSYPDSLFDYKFDGHEYRLAKCDRQDKETLEKWEEECEDWEDSLAGLPQSP